MIISFAKNGNFRHTIPNIKIDGIDAEQVDHAKLLGITISHDLSWNKHVENIVKKAGKRLYMLYQLKRAGISQSDFFFFFLRVPSRTTHMSRALFSSHARVSSSRTMRNSPT